MDGDDDDARQYKCCICHATMLESALLFLSLGDTHIIYISVVGISIILRLHHHFLFCGCSYSETLGWRYEEPFHIQLPQP